MRLIVVYLLPGCMVMGTDFSVPFQASWFYRNSLVARKTAGIFSGSLG